MVQQEVVVEKPQSLEESAAPVVQQEVVVEKPQSLEASIVSQEAPIEKQIAMAQESTSIGKTPFHKELFTIHAAFTLLLCLSLGIGLFRLAKTRPGGATLTWIFLAVSL